MKFFVDTADIGEIRDITSLGLLDGVTTNPSLVAKAGRDFKALIADICALVPGPVSAEVAATDHTTMLKEGLALAKIAPNVTVKLPLTWDGLRTCKALSSEGIQTNVTLCFSAAQALLAAKAGATFVSPFIGRIDDTGHDGMQLIRDIRVIYDNFTDLRTEILAASIRTVGQVRDAALIGADVVTVPPAIIKSLVHHPLTDKGLAQFVSDWQKTGQSIL